MDIISTRINTDLESIKNFNKEVIDLSKKRYADEDLIFKLRLILDELIINSYKHGNKKVFDRKIDCLVLLDNSYLFVKIKDEGCGIACDKQRNAYGESGRGIMLVDALSDKLIVYENSIAALVFNK
ncbi:ATP-binding protein [uncultured Anaerococcus sp.]|uniref:ATP-binding protein n=1 Tax=uncultured Anaerococcus sp. TaxID=293428 RepID=UPI00260C9FC6|nr:ATP-binding protein [uncultured Anaerococcus sp.]